MQKITNVQALEMAIEMLTANGFDTEALVKLENIKASYEKKSKSEKKPTASQLATRKVKATMPTLLEVGKEYTPTQVVALFDGEYTVQRISRVLSELVEEKVLTRREEKGKSLYSLL